MLFRSTEQAPERNRENLLWSLSRIQGFVGATNAFGPMRGERFAELADQMAAAMAELASRGLLFVDARGGAVGGAWGRGVDVVLDDNEDRDRIDARLDELSTLAREKGSALGLAMLPRPATVDRIAAWANGLAAKGVALAPVSAIALAPPTAPKGPAK